MTAIGEEELAWGFECLLAGDSIGEVADWSGRTERAWTAAFAASPVSLRSRLTGRNASLAEAYEAGLTMAEIGAIHGVCGGRARHLVAGLIAAGALARRPRPSATLAAKKVRRAYIARQPRPKGRSKTPERDGRILQLVDQLGSIRAAAVRAGVSPGTAAGVVFRARKLQSAILEAQV